MNRIAITGVSGYIGLRLLSRLDRVSDVEEIIGIDVKEPVVSSPKLKFYRRDISKPLGDIFSRNGVDSAIHLAFTLKPARDRKGAREVDVGGTANFLEACRQARVRHIVYLSSHTVYGAHPDNTDLLTEDSPLRPLSGFQYSRDKAEAERALRDFAARNQDVCLTILRSCPVTGPNAAGSVASLMFRPVMLRIAGYDPPMQFVHEKDLVALILTLLAQKKAGTFNVAGEGTVRYSEIIRLAGRKSIALPAGLMQLFMDFSWTLRLQNESPVAGLEFIKYPPTVNTARLKEEVGFRFEYSSQDALLSFLSQPEARRIHY